MRFVIGKLNEMYDPTYSWRVPDGMSVNVGDFALVENRESYDLVEVCAVGETEERYGRDITGHKGIHKYVLATITAESLIHLSQKARGME